MFTSRLSITALIAWARALRHGTDIGLPPDRSFRQLAKSGPQSARQLAGRIADRVRDGESISDALAADRDRFPLLFVEMVAVGEQTGRLTEAFEELEQYFETVRDARTVFYRALIWPGFMLVSGVGVIALMLLILGLIAPADGKGFDPLGLGLLGPTGACVFLLAAGMVASLGVAGFFYVRESEPLRAKFEAKALDVPALAGCFRAFALQRFCLAVRMASEAGERADRTLRLAFRAAGNAAYVSEADRAAKEVRSGRSVHETLEGCGPRLFPDDFLQTVEVGEVSGRLAEVMAKQATAYRDEAARKLKFLASVVGGLVYLMVGLMIVFVIIRILVSIVGVYDDAMKGL